MTKIPRIVIVGGGIVGLASAYALARLRPGSRITLLEKEDRVASHQTGRNSGVLHTGIYYTPGSQKAATCRDGKLLLEQFCRDHSVRFERCGKLIVATTADELPRLAAIQKRGDANGVASEWVDANQIATFEPHAVGVAALFVPEAGIVDYRGVASALVGEIEHRGGEVLLGREVVAFVATPEGSRLTLRGGEELMADAVVNCGGLHSDRVARLVGQDPRVAVIPFRGEYYSLTADATPLCRGLIYPVPDPRFPFLGVHFTKRIDGSVECGPNAVLAFAREGYSRGTVRLKDLLEIVSYRGFRRFARRHWRTGCSEFLRSLSRRAFARSLRRLVPDLRDDQIVPAPAGVRAQAIDPSGSLVDDFLLRRDGAVLSVLNAPSPAATASLRIGEVVAEHLLPIES